MFAKEITFVDYNNVERTETHLFNLTEAEIMEMEMTTEGGLGEMFKRIVAAKDMPSITKEFKKLLLKSYGIKSPDGRQFIKSEEMAIAFSQTEAYSKLFMELITDTEFAIKFVKGIVPANAAKEIEEANIVNGTVV